MVIQDIIQLADNLDAQSSDFQEQCLRKLQAFSLRENLSDFNDQLSRWILSQNLCQQLNVHNNFGQPPVTLFNNREFVIDLYFWLYSDTSIHTHSFKGAFKVLYGKSEQEIFNISTKKEFLEEVRFNDFSVTEKKTLKPGQCQMITQGDEFCHRVTHIDSPTITLCIRSINDLTIPQWHQFENGLSILKVEVPEHLYKSLYYSQYLLTQGSKKAKVFIQEMVEKSSASMNLNLFEEALSGGLALEDNILEVFQEVILKKYQGLDWFELYLEACS